MAASAAARNSDAGGSSTDRCVGNMADEFSFTTLSNELPCVT